jgi:hypothetical protein
MKPNPNDGNIARGILHGLALSLPVWLVVAFLLWYAAQERAAHAPPRAVDVADTITYNGRTIRYWREVDSTIYTSLCVARLLDGYDAPNCTPHARTAGTRYDRARASRHCTKRRAR